MFIRNYWLNAFNPTPSLKLSTSVTKRVREIFELSPWNGLLMDWNCQKLLVVWTYLDIQTYTPSTLPVPRIPQSVNRQFFMWGGLFFLDFINFDLNVRNGIPVRKRQKNFSWVVSWNPDSVFLKTTTLTSSINIWIDAVLLWISGFLVFWILVFSSMGLRSWLWLSIPAVLCTSRFCTLSFVACPKMIY